MKRNQVQLSAPDLLSLRKTAVSFECVNHFLMIFNVPEVLAGSVTSQQPDVRI